jgi:hypothetical protein
MEHPKIERVAGEILPRNITLHDFQVTHNFPNVGENAAHAHCLLYDDGSSHPAGHRRGSVRQKAK